MSASSSAAAVEKLGGVSPVHHQSVTYDGVRQVLSRPPDRRKDFEINNILPWFRSMKDTKVLGQLKPSILFDVIKNVQFVTKGKDELVIRQGEQGDCMYVMLRGRVTIYHNYGVLGDGTGEDGDAAVQALSVSNANGEQLRQQLGAFVVTLKEQGSAFGEVSLLTDNGTRSASIIADEPTDLIKIDRSLYSRSVQTVLRREFDQKASFIAQHPHFQNWAPKYRKQLTMALEKEILSYEFIVTKQSAAVDAIYFIVSGEIKMTMDPQLHFSQYPKLFAGVDKSLTTSDEHTANILRGFNNSRQSDDGSRSSVRRGFRRHQSIEVCLLGVNEAVGDIEALMGLTTYMQTSVCTQPCEVLVLDMRHFERLLVRRNPRTIDRMRGELELRIRSRIASRYLTCTVPLLERLLDRAAEYTRGGASTALTEVQALMANNRKNINNSKRYGSKQSPSDFHAPGAVFYRIRQQQQSGVRPALMPVSTSLADVAPSYADEVVPGTSVDATSISGPSEFSPTAAAMLQTNHAGNTMSNGGAHSPPTVATGIRSMSMTDVETDDVDVLESRMLEWLIDDRRKRVTPRSDQHAIKGLVPRITKLRRASAECEQQLKPGAKIVMRRKEAVLTPYLSQERSARSKVCSDAQLAYYRSALTDTVPAFART